MLHCFRFTWRSEQEERKRERIRIEQNQQTHHGYLGTHESCSRCWQKVLWQIRFTKSHSRSLHTVCEPLEWKKFWMKKNNCGVVICEISTQYPEIIGIHLDTRSKCSEHTHTRTEKHTTTKERMMQGDEHRSERMNANEWNDLFVQTEYKFIYKDI